MKNAMRVITFVTLAAAVSALGAAPSSPNPAWDKLKTLVGDWKGTYTGADAEGMRQVSISYKLVSNGTALMETLDSGHDTTMITMYHLDGNRLLATHYCSAGNQSRMTAAGLSPDGKTLTFRFVDATNAGPDSEVMQGVAVTFDGPDHFSQAWTSRANGKDQIGTFTYTRVP